jgi:DNA-binding CsgD family transcriptional regulator
MAIPTKLSANGTKLTLPREVLVALSCAQSLARHGAILVPVGDSSELPGAAVLGRAMPKYRSIPEHTTFHSINPGNTGNLDELLRKAILAADPNPQLRTAHTENQSNAQRGGIVRILPGRGFKPESGEERKAILLCNEDLAFLIEEQVLCSFYGLTRTEAMVAAKFIEGKSPETAAAELGASPAVMTIHLPRILMKMDTFQRLKVAVRRPLIWD